MVTSKTSTSKRVSNIRSKKQQQQKMNLSKYGQNDELRFVVFSGNKH